MSKLWTTLRRRRGGFTLIELMIVVAIIGILAAIAIPNFLRFQLRAKSGEGKTNLAAIRTAEEGYYAEFGTYVDADEHPTTLPGASKLPWDAGNGGFNTVGWSPEGDVYFHYEVAAAQAEFHAAAGADINNNTTYQAWAYVKPLVGESAYGDSPSLAMASAAGCSAEGVYDPVSGSTTLDETVGPCDSASGQSEF